MRRVDEVMWRLFLVELAAAVAVMLLTSELLPF
jgi:hypothetical protein